ncbi:Deoxyuridine 5'-triphosphate nucleotidohydrolase [compost metagenome]
MKVRIKKLNPDAVIPSYSREGDAGMDLTAVRMEFDNHGNIVYGTGLAFEIPRGYVGLLFPRSSNFKKDLILSNSVGVLDSGYRGEVMFKFKMNTVETWREGLQLCSQYIERGCYEVGDRIGQIIIIPYPEIEFEEAQELSESERGAGGYGSTGK